MASVRPVLTLVAAFALVGCRNEVPEAFITSHVQGDVLIQGLSEVFVGRVTDDRTAAEDVAAQWFLGGIEICESLHPASGDSVSCEVLIDLDADVLSAGQVELALEGRDEKGSLGAVSLVLDVVVSDPPVVEIVAPEDGSVAYGDVSVPLYGVVSDDLDEPDGLVVWWSSDLDGILAPDSVADASGDVFADVLGLSAGDHVLTLSAEDSTGAVGAASVSVVVYDTNSAPTCGITAPTDGQVFAAGATVTLAGTVGDLEDGAEGLSVSWTSDRDGEVAVVASDADGRVSTDLDGLALGTHGLTLSVVDSAGQGCSDQRQLTIGSPPVVVIDEPLSGAVSNEREPLRFQATVSSETTPAEDLAFTWTSDVNGWFSDQGATSAGIAAFDSTDLSAGVHTITVQVTDADDFTGQATVDVIINGLPDAPELVLSPDPAQTADPLSVSITSPSVDPEGDAVTYRYAWRVDGVISSASSGATLPSSVTDKGEVWEVTVTPSDDLGDGEAGTASITIANTAPVLASVDLSPADPVEGDTLTCTPGTTTDADGDAGLTYAYEWVVDGSTISPTGATLSDTWWDRGQAVACVVTPSDGSDDGAAVTSNTVSVGNTPPSVLAVLISPDPAQAADTLTCSYGGYADADGDSDASTFAWAVDGSAVGTGATLSGAFVGGQIVTCTVTPNDGTDDGTPVSMDLTIDNTAPSVTAAVISPSPAYAGDAMLCSTAGFSDDDGDSDQSTFLWELDGVQVGTRSTYEGVFIRDQVLQCQVTPSDGQDSGSPVAGTLTVSNSAPSLGSVGLSPGSPQADDTLTCGYTGYSDPDGDADASTYAWTVNGVAAGSGTDTLSSGFIGTDLVVCTVTPHDGTDAGGPLSASATIGNSAPSITGVSISPGSAVVGDTLTCSYSGYADDDGDPDASTFAWTVNGTMAGSASTLSSGFVGGDDVVCTVTPYDGFSTGTAVADGLTIDNTAPTITAVSISPASPSTGDTLTCAYAGFSDVDGDSDQSTFAWNVNGGSAGSGSTLTGGFSGGDTVVCLVTPDDGEDAGTAVGDSVTVANSAPSISSVSVSPSSAGALDTLSCSYSGYSDPDGDADQSTFAWTVDGSTAGSSSTLAGAFVGGSSVVCTVTPSDGTDSGSPLADGLVIDNTAPSVSSVSISPSDATTSDALTCSYSGFSDPDGDSDRSRIAWAINGSTVSTGTTLSAGYVGGDTVTCTVTPDDGQDDGTAVSASQVISNSLPSVASVTVSPSSPSVTDTLGCAYTGFSDADGESDQSTYAWTIDGSTVGTGDTLASGFTGGDTVTCTVTPNDGHDDGTPVSDSVTIDNTSPSITSVSISPATAQAADTLTCSYSGYSDPDGDPDQSTYAWTVDGSTVGTDATLAGAFVGTDVVVCTVTPSDGATDGTPLSDSLTIDNTAPSLSAVSISPSSAQVGDTLSCAHSGYADVDGDSDQSTYAWAINGSDAGVSATTLSSGFVGGDTVSCTVTPDDGSDAGSALSDSLVIDNSAPSISSVAISPASAQVGDTLSCAYSGFSDPDGDSDASTYGWTVNGSSAGSSATLTGGFVGGDTVICTVTPSDGADAGTPVSDSVTVGNTAPSLSSVSISPAAAAAGDTLTCAWSGFTDVDGDADQSTLLWTVNGTSAGSTAELSSGFVGGDTVTCTVTPDDGTDTGTAVAASLVVDNTAPSLTGVSISPSSAQAGDTLTCSYAGWSDVDGDSDASTYAWTVDGVDTGETSSTLSSGFVGGETVTCTVTPSDGSADGSPASDSLVIDNTAPSVSSVSISPASPGVEDTLSCSYSGFSDPDGDADASSYAWTIGGTEVGTGSSLSGAFAAGETVTCTVTPSDGSDDGTSLSDSVTVGNSPPSIAAVSIDPDPGYDGDTLTCSYSGFSDPDGDSDVSTRRWTINGTTAGTSATLFSGFGKGDTVACTVTPKDGTDSGTPVVDSVVISNSLPVLDSVAVGPASPRVADTLSCTPGATSDADGDSVTTSISWTIAGTEVGTSSTLSGAFASGDTVTCTVTPNDGDGDGAVVSDSVSIGNTAPSLSSVSISPSTATVSDTLTCSYSGFSDADGDSDQSTYEWTVNGSVAGASATLSGAFVGGDTVVCTVTPSDGTDDGTSLSDTLSIDNSAPSLSGVSISPASPTDADTLTCSYSGFSDADGDADTSTYSWTISGTEVGTSSTLSSSVTAAGDTVTCTVTPYDGTDAGTASSDSVSVIASNTAPSIGSVSISPSTATVSDTLTCSYSGFSDAEGDADQSTYSWTIGGTEVGTSSTLSSGFASGDTVTCTVTPSDGSLSGTALSDSVDIDNAPPVLTSVSVTPDAPTVADTLTCTPSSSDADGDTVTYSYSWTISGTPIGTSSTVSSGYVKGDTVVCTVTPNDGTDDGSTGADSEAIENSAPSVSSITATPSSPVFASTMTVSYSTTDLDGDGVSVDYAWFVNGTQVSTSSSLSVSGNAVKGDSIAVELTPDDGFDPGTTGTSATRTVGNTAPTQPTAIVDPSDPDGVTDDIWCYDDVASTDVDTADTVTYVITWDADGAVYPDDFGSATGPDTTVYTDDTVPAADTSLATDWTCTLTPTDGTDSGTADTAVASVPPASSSLAPSRSGLSE